MRKVSDLNIIYKAIKDGQLRITECGEIWRIGKWMKNRWMGKMVFIKTKKRRAEHEMKDYLQIRVMYNGIRYTAAAHRLIYFHFNGKIPHNKTVNHENGEKRTITR